MFTMKSKLTFALVAIALTCLVPTLAFGQDSVLSVQGSGSYDIGYYVNANMGFPDAQLHVTNPGSTGGFGSGDPTTIKGGDLCANVYVFTPDQQLAECCSCKITPNGMQSFSLNNDLTKNPYTPGVQHSGAIKIVASFGGGRRGAGLPPTPNNATNSDVKFCDAGSDYWPSGRLESWITHTRTLGVALGAAYTVTEINFQDAQLSYSEMKKLEQQCFAITADPSLGGNGSGAGTCNCDPKKGF